MMNLHTRGFSKLETAFLNKKGRKNGFVFGNLQKTIKAPASKVSSRQQGELNTK